MWRRPDGGGNDFEGMKEFSQMTARLGFEYHVVEGIWSRWTPEQLVRDYSRQQGVGAIPWAFRRNLAT